MTPKIAGCCSKCDAEVYDIVRRDPETRLPVEIGQPTDDAMRAEFILVNGSRMNLTFCRRCADTLEPHDFPFLWQRVMLSWETDAPGHVNQKQQANNGILGLAHVVPWKEVK